MTSVENVYEKIYGVHPTKDMEPSMPHKKIVKAIRAAGNGKPDGLQVLEEHLAQRQFSLCEAYHIQFPPEDREKGCVETFVAIQIGDKYFGGFVADGGYDLDDVKGLCNLVSCTSLKNFTQVDKDDPLFDPHMIRAVKNYSESNYPPIKQTI